MNSFVFNPRRDAYSAIKGFCYQVELTVMKWLELEEDSLLICECGEDIDLVKQLPDADPATQLRLLEQVKTKDRITLRSPESLTAMARFREAVANNPTLRILYRFSTTALAGQEQGIRFPQNLTGIGAWTDIRGDRFTQYEANEFVTGLKSLVAQASCPQGLQEPVFAQVKEYVESADPEVLIDEFIRRFEWATAMPTPPQLRSNIQDVLLRQSRAHLLDEAQLLADVLTVYVLHLLTQRGEKRLTVEDLEQLLHKRSITEVDRRLLTRLTGFVQQVEAYLPHLASQLELVSRGLAVLQPVPEQLWQLTQQVSDIPARLLPLQLPPPDELPLPHIFPAPRTEFVGELLAKLSGSTWLNIVGAAGMGKTSAARLIAEAHGLDRTAWISLRGEQTNESVLHRLDMRLLRLASTPYQPDLVHAYCAGALPIPELARQAAVRVGTGGLLIIDEVPDLIRDPQLGDRLVGLTTTFRQLGVKVLTTAQRGIPPSIQGHLDTAIAESSIPSMRQEDIQEMLTAAGAPPAFHRPNFINLIHAATRGHPALVSATISFLRRNAWTIDEDQLFSILTGEPAAEIRAETRRKLRQLLPNDDLRELLDRLSLIGSPFDVSLVQAVAAAPPPIRRPGELLPELIGPWIHHLRAERFEISPLLSAAGQVMLGPELQQRVHLAIGLHYLRGRTIDQEQALQIVLHLFAARSWDALTAFLLQLAGQLTEKPHAEALEMITLFFKPPWLESMPLPLRILIRTVQVRILTLLGKDAQTFIADFDTMIGEADEYALPMAFLMQLLIGPMNPAADPVMAARRTLRACRLYCRLPVEIQELSASIPLECLIWAGQTRIQTQDDIRGVLRVLIDMTEDERRAAFSYEPMCDTPQMFVDQCWIVELKKPLEERDWQGALSLLDEILRIGKLPGAEQLLAPGARAKAIVLADQMERPQEALAVLDEALPNADHNARFLLHYTAGCILLDHSTPEAALERYQGALAEPSTAPSILRFDACRRAAEAAGRLSQWSVARDLAIRSLKLFRDADLTYERLEMIGELAWAYWSLDNRVRAWGAMSGLAYGLLQRQASDNGRFREVVRKTGHVLGWMTAMVQSGAPPIHTPEGEPYGEPFPGLFSRSRPRLADIPSPPLLLLLNQLGRFASGCALYELAWRKISQARQLAQTQDLSYLLHYMDWELAELAARKEDYREALRLARSGVRMLPAARQLRELGRDLFTAQIPLEDLWDALSSEQRHDLERELYWSTIGPAIARLLAKEAPDEAYSAAIGELRDAFQEFNHELADPNYWLHMLSELDIAFSPLATRETIRDQVRSLSESELHLRLLLYLALSRSPNSTLAESCGAQAIAFDLLLRMGPVSKLMAEDTAEHLMRYWTHVSETQAFALRNPQIFRNRARSIQQPSFANVASLLLAAENATGVRFAADLRASLLQASKNS